MSEDNNAETPKPNTELPKFELPKAAAPTIKPEVNAPKAGVASVAPAQRPGSFSAPAAAQDGESENPAWVIVDALAAAVSVAFAVLIFLDK